MTSSKKLRKEKSVAAKTGGKDFEMNQRIRAYFQDRISFNQEQEPHSSEVFSFTFPDDLKYSVDIHARRRETSA